MLGVIEFERTIAVIETVTRDRMLLGWALVKTKEDATVLDVGETKELNGREVMEITGKRALVDLVGKENGVGVGSCAVDVSS